MTQLNTAPGDGGLRLDVNDVGSFGSAVGGGGDAYYNPIGISLEDQTTFKSQVAIKVIGEDKRSFFGDLELTNITNAVATPQSNSITSFFTTKGLNFKLIQTVSDIFQAQGQPRSGSSLSQTYEVTNPGNTSISIELIRYFDGDLNFDGSNDDGRTDAGGRFLRSGQEVLFETDSGETAQISTTFIGITTTEGPSASSSGRYEVGLFNEVLSHIENGDTLNNSVYNDGNDDGFADTPYDIALAFSNKYTINPGQTITYVTSTTFGQGAPAVAVLPNRPPIVANHIADATATLGTAFSLVVAADAFKDLDAGDTLTYKASLDSGAALPTWLRFDPATRKFSGTPAVSDISSIKVRVTATDSKQGSVSDPFSINVVQPTVPGIIPTGSKDYNYEFLSKEVAYKTGWKKNDKLASIYLGTKFQQVAGDYVVDAVFEDSQSGFYALGLTSITQAPVLVIRGTEPTANSYADLLSDINPNGIGSNQYTRNSIAPLAWLKNTKTTTATNRIIPPDITGHSLGGALAQAFAANATNASTTLGDIVTFNSPGVSATTVNKFKADKVSRVEHYIVSGDLVSLGGEKFLPGKYDLFDFTDLNPLNNHLKPILISQVNYGATDADKQTKAADVKAVDVSGSISDNTTSGSTNWLNSTFFTYADSEYFSVLAAAELATQAPGLQAFSVVPPALLFRGTTEKFRQVIADGATKVLNGIQNLQAGNISLALPKSDLNIFGLKLTAESLFANINGTQSLKLQGKVSLSDIYSSAIADFAGDNYVKVDNSGVEVVGSLEIRGFTIVPSLWEVRDAELKFNTAAKTIEGSADILIPAGIRVGGTLGLVNGKLDSIGINSNGLSIPIATTGALLRSIGGSIKNISTNSNTTPINFNGAVKITDSISPDKIKVALPSQFSSIIGPGGIPNVWTLDVNGTIDKNHLTGTGNLSILGGIAKGTATATLDWSQKVLSADANLSILNGFISTQAHFTANSNADITLSGAAQVKIPDFFPVGAGSTINGNFLLQYTNDNNSSNDFVASFTKIDFPRVGVFQLPSIERGTKISFDGKIDWNVGNELFAQSITAQRSANSLEVLADAQFPFAATTLQASPGLQAPLAAAAIATNQYSVQANTQWLVLNAAWTNSSSSPITVRLISPTGRVFNESDFAANNISIVNDLTDTKNRSVIIGTPAAGLWSMEVVNATGLTGLQYRAFRDSVAPTIQLDPLVDNGGQNLTINYKAIDPDSAAKISLFYSNNNARFDGTLIKNDIAENDGNGSYVWNTEGFATGDYYVYAMISDGNTAPVMKYAPGKFKVTEADDLVIKTTASKETAGIGEAVTYTTVVTNKGSTTSKGIVVTENLSKDSKLVNSSIVPTTNVNNELSFNLADLAGGASQSFTVTVSPQSTGDVTKDNQLQSITSTSTVISKTFDPDISNNTTSINTLIAHNTTLGLRKSADNVWNVVGSGNMKVSLQSRTTTQLNEIGIFKVDASNQINGVSPGSVGFAKAAITSGSVVFSTLPDLLTNGLDLSHSFQVNNGDRLGFFLVSNGSVEDDLNSNSFNNVITSLDPVAATAASPLKVTESGGVYNLDWKQGDKDLSVNFQIDNAPNTLLSSAAGQQGSKEGEILDFRAFAGQNIQATFTIKRDAAYNDSINFYKIDDASGTISAASGQKLRPGDPGYVQAALANAVVGPSLSGTNGQTTTDNKVFQGGSMYAPILVTNITTGRPEGENVFTPFALGNADRTDHIRLLGNNTFGFEDLMGGGDKDFNDVIIQASLRFIR
jgi:uncharacterized repeat protein (TIGR01451 family)